MHGRSSLMEALVWLFPFLCVKRRQKKKREDEREKKMKGKMKEKMKRDRGEKKMFFFF